MEVEKTRPSAPFIDEETDPNKSTEEVRRIKGEEQQTCSRGKVRG